MTAPSRLLSAAPSEVDPEARKLLSSALDVGPPAGSKAAIWAGLEAVLNAPPPGSGSSSGSSAGPSNSAIPGGTPAVGSAAPAATAGATLGVKVGVAALVSCLVIGAALVARPSPERIDAQVSLAPEANDGALPADLLGSAPSVRGDVLAPISRSAEAEREPRERGTAAAPTVRSAPVSASEGAASMLKREADGLRRARTELAAGNGRGALVVLGEIDRDVPRGVLGQERALVAIEALAASGQSAQAKRAAEAFLAAHPDSPHADRIRPYVGR